jgi:hypothetical protein
MVYQSQHGYFLSVFQMMETSYTEQRDLQHVNLSVHGDSLLMLILHLGACTMWNFSPDNGGGMFFWKVGNIAHVHVVQAPKSGPTFIRAAKFVVPATLLCYMT